MTDGKLLLLITEPFYLAIASRVRKGAICASGGGGASTLDITYLGTGMKLLDNEYRFVSTADCRRYLASFHDSSGRIVVSDCDDKQSIMRTHINFLGNLVCEDEVNHRTYVWTSNSLREPSSGKIVADIALAPDQKQRPLPCARDLTSCTYLVAPQVPFDIRCLMVFAVQKLIANMDIYWCGI